MDWRRFNWLSTPQKSRFPRDRGRVTKMVKELLKEGYSDQEISDELGVELRNIWRIRRRISK